MDKRHRIRTKAIIAGILVVALILGSVSGYFALSYQTKATVNDNTTVSEESQAETDTDSETVAENDGTDSDEDSTETVDSADSKNNKTADSDESEPNSSEDEVDKKNDGESIGEISLSQNVQIFTDDDASEVNNSILTCVSTNQGVYVTATKDSPLSELGVGDIFYLEGSEYTPFGETYIGKVSSIDELDSDATTLLLETPTVDEVFDELKIDYTETLDIDDISSIQTVDGVSIITDEVDTQSGVENTNLAIADGMTAGGATNALLSTGTDFISGCSDDGTDSLVSSDDDEAVINLSSNDGKTDYLGLSFDIDLLEVFGLKDETTVGFDKLDETEGYSHTVYITETGSCYHDESCPYLYASSEEITLADAVNEGYEPCLYCTPPVLSDSDSIFESTLKLEGYVGFRDSLNVDVDYDWDVTSDSGLNDLSVSLDGKFETDVKVTYNMKWEVSGKTTTLTMPGSVVKLSGLDEKLFPIAFISWNGTWNAQITPSNDTIRAITGVVPLTIGIIVYSDIDGNITFKTEVGVEYDYDFNLKYTLVENGEWVGESECDGEPTLSLTFSTELTGDVDFTVIGASVVLYVFNINILDMAIAKAGAEAEGTLGVSYKTSKHKLSDPFESADGIETDAYVYARIYAKVFDLKIKLKTKLKVWAVSLSNTVDYSWTWLDVTIAEWGNKYDSLYSSSTMSYSSVTAQDESAVYYKDTNGYLIREEDGYRTELYTDDFYCICGIDSNYIYLMLPSDDGYSVCRVSKTSTTNKIILTGVERVLTIDEKYLYYTSTFDTHTILRIDRSQLEEDTFAAMDGVVTYMSSQNNDFYVVTSDEDDMWAAMLGVTYNYYLLNSTGGTLHDYGSSPSVENYVLSKSSGGYYSAVKIVYAGYMRNTASEVYWMSGGKTETVKTETAAGWCYFDDGIFTVHEDSESSTGLKIVLYSALDGTLQDVTEINHKSALFTICQSKTGTWYYMDQTDSELILYKMSEDFSTKQIVKTFALSEISYDLDTCSMTIMDNRIYFYSMPSDTESIMIYRYDLN